MIRIRAVVLMLMATAALAGTLDFNFNSSLMYAASGPVTFSGTLKNTGTTALFINGDSITTPLPFDDTDFLFNVPPVINAGQSVTVDLFKVIVGPGTPLGLYPGSLSILGGDTGTATDVLTTAPFGVKVVPEPSTWICLVAAVPVAFVCRRRRVRAV